MCSGKLCMKSFCSICATALLIYLGFMPKALAGDGSLNIRVNLISCGPTVQAACRRDDRCCVFMSDFPNPKFVSLDEGPMTTPAIEQTYMTENIEGYIAYNLLLETPDADGMPLPLD